MHILLLSRKPSLHATRRLRQAAQKQDHEIRVVDPLSCEIHLGPDGASVLRQGRPLRNVDVIIPRIGTYSMAYGLSVLRQFELLGIPTINGSDAIARSKDKLATLQILGRKGFPIPETVVTHFPRDLGRLIERLGGTPLILKMVRGTQGMGVIKADSKEAAESVLDAMWSLGQDLLLQEFVAETKGTDIRAFVIGDRVAGAMRRRAREGEFRANYHRGAVGERVVLPPGVADLAVAAARTLGLRVAGVDLLESRRGPLILEVNSSPGFQGLEEATGLDVAAKIVAYAASLAAAAKPRRVIGGMKPGKHARSR